MAVALDGRYATQMHLAPDRWLRQHLISQFYRLHALPDDQPIVSKHWRQSVLLRHANKAFKTVQHFARHCVTSLDNNGRCGSRPVLQQQDNDYHDHSCLGRYVKNETEKKRKRFFWRQGTSIFLHPLSTNVATVLYFRHKWRNKSREVMKLRECNDSHQ